MRGGLTLRVFGASLVLTLLVAGVFGLLIAAIEAQRDSAAASLRSHEVLAGADQLLRLVDDLESGARGYVLSGQERFLDPWKGARDAVGPQTLNLEQLVALPEERQRVAQIGQAINSYVEDYSVPLVEAARMGDPSARSAETTTEGERRVEEIRNAFEEFRRTERRLSSVSDANSVAKANQSVTAAAVGLGLSAVLILLLATYLTRAIVRPVRRAAAMADRLAGDDLSARIPETGAGEIRSLERSFNQMGAALERDRAKLSRLLCEQAALRRVATLIAHGEPPAGVFAAVTEEAGKVFGADGMRLLRREPDGTATVAASWGLGSPRVPVGSKYSLEGRNVTGEVFRTGKIVSQDDFSGPEGSAGASAKRLGVQLAVGAPIIVEGQVWGAMVALALRPRSPEEISEPLAQFTELVGTAIANSQARADLAASRARLVTASDQARRRIERDLHDGVQQRLVSLTLDVRAAEAGLPDDLPEVREQLAEVARGLDSALHELREVSRGIHPAVLSKGGLDPALKVLARRSAVPVDLTTQITTRLSPPVEVAAYYVVSEALTNAAKHAKASVVRVKAATVDGRLEISIVDDGTGGADPARGSGLTGLIDRIDALGGRIGIASPPGEGTTMHVELPV